MDEASIAPRQQTYGDRLTDQSLESTRRMLRLTNESAQVGIDTMVELDAQGEQLDRIEEGLDDIHDGLKRSEKTLNQMEKCCGMCLCPCSGSDFAQRNRGAYRRLDAGRDDDDDDDRIITEEPRPSSSSRQRQRAQPGDRFVQRITDDAREDEMDENLGQVSNMLDGLKGMALDIGDTLEQQNATLDRVNRKADQNDLHLDSVNKQSRRVLRNA
ncbi:synaptosomal-associated protein 25-like [Sycon ciliatum]|uniref:synaptosomal-associated protein 25-like n=1 Tax=Sycon ciliatum TaxID=27933 RepID=UPI0020ACE8BD|eukprot:scpid89201/ scgid21787/ Synaptosomal-associated protein 25; Synaptosomal-associated 25 kDa protein